MSNSLAVAAVTTTIRFLLDQALGGPQPGPVGGAKVTTLRPQDAASPQGAGHADKAINVFLYRVTANQAWNLTDLPTRRPDGSLAQRPLTAIDLHYLITFHGDDAELDGQRLLGRAVLALAVTPVLTRDLVALALGQYANAHDVDLSFLSHADLADQVELVKLSPSVLSVEELSRLWSAFGTAFQLGVTYLATVVLLEPDVTPRTPLPVRQRALSVSPISRPRIDTAAAPDGGPLIVGATLEVRGSGLAGPGLVVLLGAANLDPVTLRPDGLDVVVTDQVAAGVRAVQVLYTAPPPAGENAPYRVLTRSNAVPVLLRPTVTVGVPTPQAVPVTLVPSVRQGQHATVTLSRLDVPSGATHTFAVPATGPIPAGQRAPANTLVDLDLDGAGIRQGTWLVTASVDGAESLPQLQGGTYSAPQVALP